MSFLETREGGFLSTLLADAGGAEHLFGTAVCTPPMPWLALRQVHSARVVEAGQWREGLEADGLAGAGATARLAVKTADCVPLLLYDPRRRAVAAVHAGWRGTAQEIAREAVRFLAGRFGSRPEDLLAALGPAIGGCCYEVGPEVAARFQDWFPERNDLERRTKVDLREALRRQLVAAGVQPARIDVAEHCTCCGGRRFHSWRRDGTEAGRMISVIGLRDRNG